VPSNFKQKKPDSPIGSPAVCKIKKYRPAQKRPVTFRPNFSIGLAFYISIIEKQKMKVNFFHEN
jgi:hypothetical protein